MSEVAASALLVRLGIAAEAQVATFKPNGCPARPCLEPEAPFGCASTARDGAKFCVVLMRPSRHFRARARRR